MDKDCLFCKIINNVIPSNKIYEDDLLLAFNDINPQAPIHIIIVPKKHIRSLSDISQDDKELLGHIQFTISKIAKSFTELKNGYRVVNNCGNDGGQTVDHIHYHLLGGRVFGWPPG
ncbi:MAG: histidine triad nucleotide-binding protein [Elusimicrobiota bacterium]|jgi:histidine triad (HIT) family protein|nr:histidine triad nucleotide-binding protein [Elusimicrobiota bacterium]